MKRRKFLVIYEKSKSGFSAYVPDLPGCTSAGATKAEVEEISLRQYNSTWMV